MIFEFEFEFTFGSSWPELEFPSGATKTILEENNKKQRVLYQTDVTGNKLIFKNINKKESDTIIVDGQTVQDQTVRLIKILADDILLNPKLIDRYISFRPEYLPGYLTYCKENNIEPPEIAWGDTYYFNGTWAFESEIPFWPWYARCRQEEDAKNFSRTKLEMYIGTPDQANLDLLEKLKELIKNNA